VKRKCWHGVTMSKYSEGGVMAAAVIEGNQSGVSVVSKYRL